MVDILEEVHRATMMNPRAVALYGPLAQPGEKLCVFAHDGWPVLIEKPEPGFLDKNTGIFTENTGIFMLI